MASACDRQAAYGRKCRQAANALLLVSPSFSMFTGLLVLRLPVGTDVATESTAAIATTGITVVIVWVTPYAWLLQGLWTGMRTMPMA